MDNYKLQIENDKLRIELAFIKAKQFDAITGYFLEAYKNKHGCVMPLPCSGELLIRYQLHRGDYAAVVIGFIERNFEHDKQPTNGESS